MILCRIFLLFFISLSLSTGLLAQDGRSSEETDSTEDQIVVDEASGDEIQSDRPIIIRVPDLEDHRHQIELDVLVTRNRDGSPTKVRFPVLYRMDSGPRTEIRLQTDFLTIQNPNVGFGDISLGGKWRVGPSTSLIGSIQIPTGSAGFSDGAVEPTLVVAQDFPLSERWELGVNLGLTFNRDSSTREYYGEFNAAAQLGYHLTSTTQLNAAVLYKTPDAFVGGVQRLSGALGIGHQLDVHNRLNFLLGRSFSTTGDDYLVLFGWAHKI